MIFFTHRLHDGCQPNSGWERRAYNEWKKKQEIYSRYSAVIAPLLPAIVNRLDRSGPHDAVVKSISQKAGCLTIVLDAQHALGQFRGREVILTFSGVKRKIKTHGLVGQWWLYQEVHLSSQANFALHVFFDDTEIEIEADSLKIKTKKYRVKKSKLKTQSGGN
jgi:hypothetical protein